MNQLLDWLQGGDLRSDGLSPEVVKFVLNHPELLPELLEGLLAKDDLVRGRAADAIEHIVREEPEAMLPYLSLIRSALGSDSVPMVRWHLAMTIGHLALDWKDPRQACELLLACLTDESVFVVSWAIVSLCIYARLFPSLQPRILAHVARYRTSPSAAIRSKVKNAVMILQDHQRQFPKGWIKSNKIRMELAQSA
jgi:HEAT repeat protein